MRRKAVEKLIDARIARQPFDRSWSATMETSGEVRRLVREVGFLRGELDEAVETMYRNGGDRRSDPNRADRNPKNAS